jgi:ketosteroid isomerase-like protein
MASANLDLVHSIVAAWERGDFGSADWAHPEIEYVIDGGPAPGSWTGRAGMAAGARGILDAWDEGRVEADEYRELDAARVLVFARLTGRGRTSGMGVGLLRMKGAFLFHVHGGEVTRHVVYWDRERAVADLGLSSL